jgi:nucleotide-binding universal stress UspA family protein
MASFKKIIVDLDATGAAHPALDRALELARYCRASVRLVDVVTIPSAARHYLPDAAERIVTEDRRQRLLGLAQAAGEVETSIDVLRGRPADAIIDAVVAGGHDLVIRSHARDLAAGWRAPGAVDMQLFRSCPCAVWSVGPGVRTAPSTVVAAVHANRQDAEEQQLNARIIEAARLMADAGNGRLIVLYAWHAFAEEMLRHHYAADDHAAYVDAAAAEASRDMEDLSAATAGPLNGARIELVKGQPEDVIPAFVAAEGVDLVVLGTVARGRIAGAVIGNTAERLLQRLSCSVMAIKPERFRVGRA